MIAPVGVLWFLATWSIRWGILILGLMLWFKVRPPKRAATRHLLCGSVLIAGLALPLAPGWTAPWPRWGLVGPERLAPAPIAAAREARPEPILPPVETQPEPIRPAFVAPPALPSSPAPRPVPLSKPARPVEIGKVIPLILGLIWLTGSLGVLTRLAAGWWGLSRLRRAAKPLVGPCRTTFDQARRDALPIRRRVEVAMHPAVGSPIALGGWSPMILLPTSWDTWTEADQRAALLHELAHLARGDDTWKLVGELIHAPFWFHPGVAWLTTRLDREAELAADEATVALGIPPRDLARLLLDCARRPHRLAPGWWLKPRSALSFFSKETVSTRINRLLEDDMPLSLTRPSKLHQLGLGSLIIAFALAIGGAHGGVTEPTQTPATEPITPARQEPKPQADSSFVVIVRDALGQPVPGANVLLCQPQPNRATKTRAIAETEAKTDADGKVKFEPLSGVRAWVVAFQDGYCFVVVDLPVADRKAFTTLTLPRGRRVVGMVQDPDGQPIEGAEVAVSPTGGQGGIMTIRPYIRGTRLESRLIARTGPDGRFQFGLLTDQPQHELQITAAGRAPVDMIAETVPTTGGGPDPAPAIVTLAPEGRVQGQVVTSVPGVGLNGREVHLQVTDSVIHHQAQTTTDDTGRFEFTGLPAAQVQLSLWRLTGDHPFTARPVNVLVRSGQTTEVTLELIAGTELNGLVVTADGKPVGGLSVSAMFDSTLGRQTPLRTTTDAAGAYQFRVPSGPVQIRLDQFQSPYSVVGSSTATREIVVPVEVATLVVPPIVVAPITPLSGKLTDAADTPIEGAELLALTDQQFNPLNPNAKPAVTDAEGRFRLEKLTDGQVIPVEAGITLQIRLRDGREFNLPTVTRADGSSVLVKLPTFRDGGPRGPDQVAADEVAGVVVDPQGRPIAGVQVSPISWTGRFVTLSDQNGVFRRKVPEQELMEVRLTKEGWEPREILNWKVGEAGRVVVLDNRTMFTGRVLGPDGTPVVNAPIRVDGGPRQMSGARMRESITLGQSGPDGRYRLFVEPGMYEFQIRVPGRGVLRLPGQAIGTDEVLELDLTLAAGVSFEARVVNSQTGAPVEGFKIEDWRNKALSGTSNADGVVIIPSMLPGRFSFGPLHDDTFARWWSDACVTEFSRFQPTVGLSQFQRNFNALDFDLKPGMAPVTIQLEPAAVVRGVVLDPDGQPVAGATVAPALTGTGNSLTGDTRYSVTTDAAGKFTVPLPASGKIQYNLVAHDGKLFESRTWANGVGDPFSTTPGQVIDGVTLRLTRPATVTGRVIEAATGQSVAGCEVEAIGADQRDNRYLNPTTRTEANGTFTLRGIRPGDGIIKTAHPGVGETGQALTLTEGETRAGILLKTTLPQLRRIDRK